VARVEYVPEVGLVRVTGANASGKTSLLRAIMAALGGAGEVLPDTIRDDAVDGGEVLVKLAVEHDFQVWLARIGLEGGGEIVVEDGVARNNSEV